MTLNNMSLGIKTLAISVAEKVASSLTWSETSKDRFSCDVAHIVLCCKLVMDGIVLTVPSAHPASILVSVFNKFVRH